MQILVLQIYVRKKQPHPLPVAIRISIHQSELKHLLSRAKCLFLSFIVQTLFLGSLSTKKQGLLNLSLVFGFRKLIRLLLA